MRIHIAIHRLPLIAGAIFLFFLVSELKAQDRVRIRLKSNTTIKRMQLYAFDSTGILIKAPGNEAPHKLNYTQIKTIKFLGAHTYDQIPPTLQESETFYDRLYHHVSLGVLFGKARDDFSMQVINGYKINNHFHAGVGIGYDKFNFAGLLPVFVEAKGHISSRHFLPYGFVQLGHNIVAAAHISEFIENYSHKGGIFWRGGIGYQVDFRQTALTFSFAYSHQRFYREYSLWNEFTEEKFFLNRVDFKVGFLF